MVGKGKHFIFHGGFDSKRSAIKNEKKVHGFILKRGNRYYVLTKKKGSK